MNKTIEKIQREIEIIEFCKTEFKSLADISEQFNMNKNTLRAGYLYPLANEGRLLRSTSPKNKSAVKYKASKTAFKAK